MVSKNACLDKCFYQSNMETVTLQYTVSQYREIYSFWKWQLVLLLSGNKEVKPFIQPGVIFSNMVGEKLIVVVI